ncbi:MAG: M50 family metallopeptidase [Lewinella sp.]|nr:M50 family metallopeptidase [Lewinella sp.]
MKTALQVGKIAGVPIQFHWTFTLVLLWLLLSSWQIGYGIDWGMLAWLGTWVGLVFLAVLLHELGHALMARRFRIGTERIVLYPLGGGAFLEQQPTRSGPELLIALAGPLVNLVLALLMVPLVWGHAVRPDLLRLMFNPGGNFPIVQAEWYDYALVIFLVLNLILALFNLLPAFPLDGGRMLRAVLSRYMDRIRASLIAAWVGIAFALAFLLIAWWVEDWFFAIGALFIGLLAMAEIRMQHQRRRLTRIVVSDHLDPSWVSVHSHEGDTLADIRAQLAAATGAELVLILDEWQQPYAVSTREAICDPSLDQRQTERFLDLLGPSSWQGLHPEENLLRLANLLDDGSPHCGFPVVDDYGQLVGLLSREKALRIMKKKEGK